MASCKELRCWRPMCEYGNLFEPRIAVMQGWIYQSSNKSKPMVPINSDQVDYLSLGRPYNLIDRTIVQASASLANYKRAAMVM